MFKRKKKKPPAEDIVATPRPTRPDPGMAEKKTPRHGLPVHWDETRGRFEKRT